MSNDIYIMELYKSGVLRVDFQAGLVYSNKANDPKNPLGAPTTKGYLRTTIQVSGKSKSFLIHRIVWVAAHGPLPDGKQIDHVNTNKKDNRLKNLEAVSNLENAKRAKANGLSRGGWRNAPRKINGQFASGTGRLLDGVEHNGAKEVTQ